MCLGIPGRIVEIIDEDLLLAKAEVSGVRRNINIGLVHNEDEQVEIGDWVLIHVGFAMSRLNETEAQSQLQEPWIRRIHRTPTAHSTTTAASSAQTPASRFE